MGRVGEPPPSRAPAPGARSERHCHSCPRGTGVSRRSGAVPNPSRTRSGPGRRAQVKVRPVAGSVRGCAPHPIRIAHATPGRARSPPTTTRPGSGRDTRDRGRHDASSRQIPASSAVPRRTSPSSGSRRRIRFPGRGGPSHAGAMREARGDGRGQERREGAGSCRARRRRASPPPQRPTRQRARSRCSTVRPTRARRRPPPPETRSRGGRHAKNPVPAREGSP